MLKRQSFANMIDVLIYVSLQVLPLLASPHADPTLEMDILSYYINRLLQAKERAMMIILQEFFGAENSMTRAESLTRTDFTRKFVDARIHEPTLVRRYIDLISVSSNSI